MEGLVRIEDALQALNIVEWTLTGQPSNETEFNAQFKKVIGVGSNGAGILSSDPSDFGVTWSQVSAKKTELVTAYDAKKYQRDRAKAYPSIADQLDDIYHNGIDEWKKTIKVVKDKYAKG